jgi:tetratricopeptide (TPR) repeat protein
MRLADVLLAFTFGSLVCAIPTSAEVGEVDPTWEAAVAHLEARRFAEAIPLLREVDRTHPDDPSVLWNLGIALAAVADHSAALATWERLDANGDDWRVVAKRIQSSQSLGNADEVRQLRERLIALRARPDAPKDLVEAERYCREQFRLDDHLVFAYEHFDPSGRRMVFYSFAFAKPSGEQEFVVSFGSYEDTTAISRELGEIGQDERVYHLDRYEPGLHATYGFFDRLLSYEETRDATVAAVRRDRPLSASGSRGHSPLEKSESVP